MIQNPPISSLPQSRRRANLWNIAYWLTTIMGPFSFVMGGLMFLMHDPHMVETLGKLGYPAYMATILGIGNLLGAIICVLPGLARLKEWAYAGFTILLLGAFASHILHGDSLAIALQPIFFLILVLASWASRPASRRLPSETTK